MAIYLQNTSQSVQRNSAFTTVMGAGSVPAGAKSVAIANIGTNLPPGATLQVALS